MTIAEPEIEIVYPESDGAPLGDNTLQVKWIIALHNGFDGHFRFRDDVFVASNLFWYPIEGNPKRVTAPDVMIVFGRPPGHRPSYRQWDEQGIGPQVTIEVLSPCNSDAEMEKRLRFYQKHGVEEYYLYDPYLDRLQGWVRKGNRLAPVGKMEDHVSPLLQVRFEANCGEPMRIFNLRGERFLDYLELLQLHDRQQEMRRREKAKDAKLRELGIDPDTLLPGA